MLAITQLLAMISALVSDRTRLATENLALRQQIAVLKRTVKRANIEDSDRVFWILMKRLLENWKECLLISHGPGTEGRADLRETPPRAAAPPTPRSDASWR